MVHNHDWETGKCHYRYPRMQFKVIDQRVVILALESSTLHVFREIAADFDHLRIHDQWMAIEHRAMEIVQEPYGMSPTMRMYQWVTPWMALNAENYRKYRRATGEERADLLRRCLIGNLLTMSRSLDYHVDQTIRVTHRLTPQEILFKGERFIGFTGHFEVNFYLPDFLGIGKACSHGYGCCIDLSKPLGR